MATKVIWNPQTKKPSISNLKPLCRRESLRILKALSLFCSCSKLPEIFWFSGFLINKAGIHITIRIIENTVNVVCQPVSIIKKFDRAGNINIPKPPKAVTYPAALLLFSFGKCLVAKGANIGPEHAPKPIPTINPRLS